MTVGPFAKREPEIVTDPLLGRPIRTGDLAAQSVSNVRRARAAIEVGAREEALAFIDFIALSAAWNYDQQTLWIAETHRFLLDCGIAASELAGVEADIAALIAPAGAKRFDGASEWHGFHVAKARLVRELSGPAEIAVRGLDRMVSAWRGLYDRSVDYLAGLMNVIVVRFGEERLETLYRQRLVEPVFADKYRRYDVSLNPWEEMFNYLVYISVDGRRAHLAGQNRLGDADVTEYEDRVVISIDPCSSGGRLLRGEPLDGSGSRMEQPFFFRALEKAHDWAWGRKGVCAYCAHCCLLHTKLPIERFGYPLRVLDPPTYPDRKGAKCTWTMYRRLEDIPAEAYLEVGERKPEAGTPLGSARVPA